ncbi:MAG: biotin transporter BioY [Oscillospiraceae bacterium]|nr:biotin transporter BioY [Oscillospiraceae bacterium]
MKTNTRMMILAACFAALTMIGTLILKIPIGGLSVTLQVFFTCLSGVLLGAKWGAISQAIYVALGLIGLPVFTMGGGPGYVFQPSFGFLLALIPMAWLIGMLTRGNSGVVRIVLACIAGEVVLYAIGLPYMYAILNVYLQKELSFAAVAKIGMLVYLPWDAVKIAIVSVLSKPLCRAVKHVNT